eukprot:12918056-Prorocentrum_lima.AAC.1
MHLPHCLLNSRKFTSAFSLALCGTPKNLMVVPVGVMLMTPLNADSFMLQKSHQTPASLAVEHLGVIVAT